MIKTLRKKIILITLLSVGLVLALLVTTMNLVNYRQVIEEADDTLAYLALYKGRFPGQIDPQRPMRPEAQFDTRYFSVLINKEENLLITDLRKIYAVSVDEAISYAQEILESGKKRGTIKNYRYLVEKEEAGSRVMFIDIERSLNSFYAFLINSLTISLVGMILVLILALIFSKILLKPVEEAYRKQRRFITDASHELKTPITIIKANMDVLELTQEENQWTQSTIRQANRMGSMVNDLLFLAGLDEGQRPEKSQTFDLKDLLEEVIEDHQPIISENFKLSLNINSLERDLDYNLIKRLFTVLIENSLRYGISGKEISIELSQGKNKTMLLKITNQANIDREDYFKDIFQRFKRSDEARNQAHGGSGIGLSIAKSIVDFYQGKIEAYSEDAKSFTVSVEL